MSKVHLALAASYSWFVDQVIRALHLIHIQVPDRGIVGGLIEWRRVVVAGPQAQQGNQNN
jgi:hypothetical protein